jgi:glucosamine--fructose-6-phosphate aminotransferase (isomerizing)
MCSLASEIRQQPQVLAAVLDQELKYARQIAVEFSSYNVKYVIIAASLFSIYGQPPCLEDALVGSISQSGQSADIVTVLAEGRQQGVSAKGLT